MSLVVSGVIRSLVVSVVIKSLVVSGSYKVTGCE